MAELKDFFVKVISCLDRSKLPYAIVGDFAAIIRGRARTTTDIDIVVNATTEEILVLLDCFEQAGLDVMKRQALLALKEGTNLSIFDTGSYARLDLKRARTEDEREVVSTAKTERYGRLSIMVATIEEILYGKILYLGRIDELPDKELLDVTDALDFLVLYNKHKNDVDHAWLETKVKIAGLTATLERLAGFKVT